MNQQNKDLWKNVKHQKEKNDKIQLQTYISTDGDTILVGKIISKMII